MAREPWRDLFTMSVEAFYSGDHDRGREACRELRERDDLPPGIEMMIRQNEVFYTRSLPDLAPTSRFVPFDIPVTPGWSSFNPSIAAAENGFRAIVRSANYFPVRDTYELIGREQVFRSENYLVEFDPELAVTDVTRIEDRTELPERFAGPALGYENARLVRWGGKWHALAEIREGNLDAISQIACVRLKNGAFSRAVLLSDWRSGEHARDWTPVADTDRPAMLTSLSPTVALGLDPRIGATADLARNVGPRSLAHARGGSQLVPFDGGYLTLVRETVFNDEGLPATLHRWVAFDRSFRVAWVSALFHFISRGREYVAGLAPAGSDLVISVGLGDRESMLVRLAVEDVRRMRAADVRHRERSERAVTGAGLPEAFALNAGDAGQQRPMHDEEMRMECVTPAAPVPWLVSTTLTGNARDTIGGALASVVGLVDACLVIDTGVTDDTLLVAREVAGAKLVVRQFPWVDDFAAARNIALDEAAALGATWAVTVDTDERIDPGGSPLRSLLAASDLEALRVSHRNGTYGKERFFRLPATGRWSGRTHEAFIPDRTAAGSLPGVTFEELPKDRASLEHKFLRDIAILEEEVATRPDDPRWWYYLGDARQNLGRHEEAIPAYRRCWDLDGWDEEAGWAMYRAAECMIALGRPLDAVAVCADGMQRHAGMPELPWQAGYASYQAGRYRQAVHWARVAAGLGRFRGCGEQIERIAFRRPRAHWEGPYDVLRFALRKLGESAAADEAERLYDAALAARQRAEVPD